MRHASQDGEFSLNRNIRHGPSSRKGKEREHHQQQNYDTSRSAGARKTGKTKRAGNEKAREAEKEVYIPSTVTVSRLADIFGKKICTSYLLGLVRVRNHLLIMAISSFADPHDAAGHERGPAQSRLL